MSSITEIHENKFLTEYLVLLKNDASGHINKLIIFCINNSENLREYFDITSINAEKHIAKVEELLSSVDINNNIIKLSKFCISKCKMLQHYAKLIFDEKRANDKLDKYNKENAQNDELYNYDVINGEHKLTIIHDYLNDEQENKDEPRQYVSEYQQSILETQQSILDNQLDNLLEQCEVAYNNIDNFNEKNTHFINKWKNICQVNNLLYKDVLYDIELHSYK